MIPLAIFLLILALVILATMLGICLVRLNDQEAQINELRMQTLKYVGTLTARLETRQQKQVLIELLDRASMH